MSMEKWWNEICGRGKREKPREKPTQTPFPPPRNPLGVTEKRTRDPSGERRASNRLRHEAFILNGSLRKHRNRCGALWCGGKELSAENKIRLPHRIRTRSLRFVCPRMTETTHGNIVFHNSTVRSFNFEKLINLIQKYQFLYDKSDKYYCNNIRRVSAWTEISNSLGNATGNYTILYSVIYILRNFCNVLQYEIQTIMTFHSHDDNFNN